jgi:hypothetical protein
VQRQVLNDPLLALFRVVERGAMIALWGQEKLVFCWHAAGRWRGEG